MERLGKHARMITAMADAGDIDGAKNLYKTIYPEASKILGANLPADLDPSMLPHMKQIADAVDPQQKSDYIQGRPGDTFVDPRTGKPAFSIPAAAPQLPNSVQEVQYYQQHPEALATYQKMHPRPAAGGGGLGHAPSGYRFTKDGSLEAIPGGPADSSGTGQGLSGDAVDNAAWSFIGTGKLPPIGRGKEGVAQRTAIMNHAAKIAKEAGISPSELQTVPGRNKALQASLTNLQKTSDVMEKSEQAFLNNTNTALQISAKVDRTGSPVINKWLLGGKDALGDPDVRALDAAITTMSVDYARIMSGATGAGGTPISTAEEAKSLIKKELSDKSLRAVVAVLEQDIKGQQAAVHGQRGKILGAMQQMHDDAAPTAGGAKPQENDADPLSLR